MRKSLLPPLLQPYKLKTLLSTYDYIWASHDAQRDPCTFLFCIHISEHFHFLCVVFFNSSPDSASQPQKSKPRCLPLKSIEIDRFFKSPHRPNIRKYMNRKLHCAVYGFCACAAEQEWCCVVGAETDYNSGLFTE